MICRNHPEHGDLADDASRQYIGHCPTQCPQYVHPVEMAARIVALERRIAALEAFVGEMPEAPRSMQRRYDVEPTD